jgi:hypothetical protein
VSEPRGCFLKQQEEKLWKNNRREISCLLFKHVEISIFCGHHLKKRIKIIPQHAHIVPIFPFTALSVSADLFSLHESKKDFPDYFLSTFSHPRSLFIIQDLKTRMSQSQRMSE